MRKSGDYGGVDTFFNVAAAGEDGVCFVFEDPALRDVEADDGMV